MKQSHLCLAELGVFFFSHFNYLLVKKYVEIGSYFTNPGKNELVTLVTDSFGENLSVQLWGGEKFLIFPPTLSVPTML